MAQFLVAIHLPDDFGPSRVDKAMDHDIDALNEEREAHGLADEVLLIVYPVLLGTGKRIFAEGTPPRSFELVSTKALASGVILSTYKPTGPLRTGSEGG